MFYDYFEEEQLSVYAPITVSYKVRGYVIIHKPLRLLTSFHRGFLDLSYFTFALLFFCALILFGIYACSIILPIQKITKAANAYAEGKFDYPICIPANDEMGRLAASLAYMANEIGRAHV